jgi:anaerobic selenocysteine-containing dehydrogenase
MTMTAWKKTFCALCYHNCGLEVQTEGHRILKVRPDKNHPRTKGYICRKGTKIAHYQDNKDRLTRPLKREGDGFVPISWERAIAEIAERLKAILAQHGPRCLAYLGGGGQGCHLEAAFGRNLLLALGSQYHYSAVAQELTGLFWVNGRAYGRQNLHLGPDLDRARNFLCIGWNGYVSNAGVNRARSRIDEFAKDPGKRLIVVDPFLSETAKRADIHLKIRMGSLALFLKSMIAVILQEGWENKAYIEEHCRGFEKITGWFSDFDVAAALEVCEVDMPTVREVARIYSTEPTGIRSDLGLLMDRQSTMNSYLEMILMALCGGIGTPGGNVFMGHVMPLGSHSDERDPKTWRTAETDIPAIMGYFPPNVIPEEILSGKKDRLRAMIVSGANPLRSYADTAAYEEAFKKLGLLVTIEVAMSETARMSHYVLPAKSAFEKWDTTFFNLTFPEVYFQLRHPHCEGLGDALEEGEIYTRLAESLGLLPEIPDSLYQASEGDRPAYAAELMTFLSRDKATGRLLPFIVAKTLGRKLGSAHLAALWGTVMMYPRYAADNLKRAGYEVTPLTGEALFQELLEHPEGILAGRLDPDRNLEELRTEDKKIDLYIEEMAEWMLEIEPAKERAAMTHPDYPFVLMAGRHFPFTANVILRDPAWNEHKEACTLLISAEDARDVGVDDGGDVWVSTEASRVKIRAEISPVAQKGAVVIPHGFGLSYDGEVYGVNVNQLTKNTHRDRLAGTPLHRYVPCRIEPC